VAYISILTLSRNIFIDPQGSLFLKKVTNGVPCLPNCSSAIERSCSRAGLLSTIGRIYDTLAVVIIADGGGE